MRALRNLTLVLAALSLLLLTGCFGSGSNHGSGYNRSSSWDHNRHNNSWNNNRHDRHDRRDSHRSSGSGGNSISIKRSALEKMVRNR